MTCKLHHMCKSQFFYGRIYNFHDYSTYKIIINVLFVLNMKICRILRFTIRSYDLRSHLPLTILCKIPILTTLTTRKKNMRQPRKYSIDSKLCTRICFPGPLQPQQHNIKNKISYNILTVHHSKKFMSQARHMVWVSPNF